MTKENRTKFIQVPVRESERQQIKKLAEEQGLPMSIYMRNLALRGTK